MANKTVSVKKKRKLSKSAIVLIVGLCIIIIPCIIFCGILLHAALQTGTPVFGDRYKGDLDPAISDSAISEISDTTMNLTGVEAVDCTLISGQLRVNVDTVDSISLEDAQSLVNEVYEVVDDILPVSTYFTSTDDKKMYDLAINVYNFIDTESEDMIYCLGTKNAMMEDLDVQIVSEPLDSELASELRGETLPTPTPSSQNVIE